MDTLFKVCCFNCNGYKGSQAYVDELIKMHDITFLSGHWLRQNEIRLVNEKLSKSSDKYWSCLKSSIDSEIDLTGRPFGGIGFICKQYDGVYYKEIECDCDKISVIQICDNTGVKTAVFGIYLPYWTGTSDQIELYVEVLDKVQQIIENHCEGVPIVIMGDMNTNLPCESVLKQYWYKSRPYNTYSEILYNFVANNDLYVCDFLQDQIVDYMFHRGCQKSYIDHVLVSRYKTADVSWIMKIM